MNDLYLIGNGFDLAHGLKTSYNDFLLWYLNDSVKKFWEKDHFEDELMKIDRVGNRWHFPSSFDTIPNLIQFLEQHDYKRKANHDFFENLVKNYRDRKWVDIEYEYYTALVKHYKDVEINPQSKDSTIKAVMRLNFCFNEIKRKLDDYLSSIEVSKDKKNELIGNVLMESTGPVRDDFSNNVGEKLFVCFNYTDTLKLYADELPLFQFDSIHIHGKLKDSSNPMVFGYGDEMDPHYEKIENLNAKPFLDNMKSFGYFRTNNYQRVMRFVDSEEYTVKILGHSCGLSDRILLNTIFEHPNCKHIKIFHYEKSAAENDYFEKTQEISRHFKASKKGEMRLKIVPFDKYSAMPQNPKDN